MAQGREGETGGKTKLVRLRDAGAESDGETKPEAPRDGWRQVERREGALWNPGPKRTL